MLNVAVSMLYYVEEDCIWHSSSFICYIHCVYSIYLCVCVCMLYMCLSLSCLWEYVYIRVYARLNLFNKKFVLCLCVLCCENVDSAIQSVFCFRSISIHFNIVSLPKSQRLPFVTLCVHACVGYTVSVYVCAFTHGLQKSGQTWYQFTHQSVPVQSKMSNQPEPTI